MAAQLRVEKMQLQAGQIDIAMKLADLHVGVIDVAPVLLHCAIPFF